MLQFGPGNLTFDIPLTLVDDDVFELTETLQASLSFPGGIAPPRVLIDPGLATVTIFDDDGEFIYTLLMFGIEAASRALSKGQRSES